MRSRLPRGSTFNRVQIARAAVVVVLGTMLVALVMWLAAEDLRGGGAAETVAVRPVGPLRAEFERCNALGYTALEDDGCHRAWVEHRRRFFEARR